MSYDPFNLSPLYHKDLYKLSHPDQYPLGLTLLASNLTPRRIKLQDPLPKRESCVFFGLNYFIRTYLLGKHRFASMDLFNTLSTAVIGRPQKGMSAFLDKYGSQSNDYFPIAIYALPEGSVVRQGVPALVIYNTDPEFPWLTTAFESLMLSMIWGPSTVATVAFTHYQLLERYAMLTCDKQDHLEWQLHDFSLRGMWGAEAGLMSGLAHLHYFRGTDNLPALIWSERMGGSIPATEHSVMCAHGQKKEFEFMKHLITELYPAGLISIVCDTWDFWHVVSDYLPRLREIILNRPGKVVIRPDSGDPMKILFGSDHGWCEHHSRFCRDDQNKRWKNCAAQIGLLPYLDELFGSAKNKKGYRVLNPCIGIIWGEGVSYRMIEDILERARNLGYASENFVFGIGAFSYQYHTRDTLGWAMKATYAEIDGKPKALFKAPKTDKEKLKTSAKGLVKVIRQDNFSPYELLENVTFKQFHEADNCLKLHYKDGKSYLGNL